MYYRSVVDFIFRYIKFESNHIVVDLGGGTGEIGHRIWKLSKLTHPVLCVDPSKEMLDKAKQKEGVVTSHTNAEKFFSSTEHGPANRILMCACIHHISDYKATFAGVKEALTSDGILMIVNTSTLSHLFSAAKKAFIPADLKSARTLFEMLGMNCRYVVGAEKFPIEKTLWYSALRGKFMSSLHHFTDDEIEGGILELEQEVSNQETLDFEIVYESLIITKT